MSSATAISQLQQVASFLSAALSRVQCIKAGASGAQGLQEAAASISSACDTLKPHLVRMSIMLSNGPAPPATVDSFCSSSLPSLSVLASASATMLAGADDVRHHM